MHLWPIESTSPYLCLRSEVPIVSSILRRVTFSKDLFSFFFFNASLGRMVVFYPSPVGATESLLSLGTWDELARTNQLLTTLATDVEALLVRSVQRRGGFECYIVPIDACYELVGRIRRHWKGFDGGEDAWTEIDTFFAEVRARSTAANPETVTAE